MMLLYMHTTEYNESNDIQNLHKTIRHTQTVIILMVK